MLKNETGYWYLVSANDENELRSYASETSDIATGYSPLSNAVAKSSYQPKFDIIMSQFEGNNTFDNTVQVMADF